MSNNLSQQGSKKPVRWIDKICRPLLFSRLRKIEFGQVKIIDHCGEQLFGNTEESSELTVERSV